MTLVKKRNEIINEIIKLMLDHSNKTIPFTFSFSGNVKWFLRVEIDKDCISDEITLGQYDFEEKKWFEERVKDDIKTLRIWLSELRIELDIISGILDKSS